MSRVVEISTQLREWATLAGYSLTPGGTTDDGRAILWSDGGEIRHFVGIDDAGWCVVTDSDRLGPEYFTIAAPSVTTVETYFFGAETSCPASECRSRKTKCSVDSQSRPRHSTMSTDGP